MATQVSGIVEQVQPKGSSGTKYAIASTAYGYCQTTADKKEKIVDMTGFKLINGVTIHVKFQYNNTAASPTLNVNGTGALNIVQYGTTAVGTTDETNSWYAGAVVSFTYDGTSWVRDQGFNTNTTYTFENGTNGFKVTPLGGTAQTVTVTPSITNNITGTGTANYLTKFTGTNTIGTTGIAIDSNNNLTIPSTLIKFTALGEGLELSQNNDYFGTNYDARIISIIDSNPNANSTAVDGGLIIQAVGRVSNTDTVQELLRIRNHNGSADWKTGEFQWKTKDVVVEVGKANKTWDISIAGDAATVNGHTVEKNVPSDAVFTDTNKYHKSGSWSGLTYTATAVNNADELKFTIPDNYGDTKNPYGAKAKNLVLAGPSSGSNAAPSFRALVAADIPDISGTYVKKITSTDNAIARFDGTNGAIQNSSVKIDDNGHIIIGAAQSIYQNQADTSNYTEIITWLKNSNGWIKEGTTYYTYQPQIGQHNTGGDGTGSITILPYPTDTAPWGGSVGLFIRKDQISLDNNRIPNTGNTTGNVGGATTPVYIDGGVIKPVALKDTANALINALDTGSSPLTTNDYVITQYVGGGTTTTTYHRRPASQVVNGTLVKAALGTVGTTAKKFLKDTGAWTQVDWGDLTGKPSTFTPATHNHSQIVTVGDNRSVATTPNDYKNALIFQGLKGRGYIGSPSTDTYSYVVGLRGWSDYSGGDAHEFAFNNNGINWRHGATDTWSEWKTIAYTDSTVARATADASGNTITSTYAPIASPTFTGTPKSVTPSSSSDNKMIATKEYVDGIVAANDAMVYKGVKAGAATSSSNAYGALTPAANCGDTYKVSVAGFINGLRVEIGDMLICTTDNTAEATSSNYTTIRNNWNIIQTSEGSVSTSSTSSTDNAIARWDSTSGRIIQDSKITIDDNGNLLISHAASATMTADSTNPKITFAENGTQPVHLIYSDYDSYRSPAGLKIIGGTSATPAWLEVEGNVYAAAFKGNADSATTATNLAAKPSLTASGNNITVTAGGKTSDAFTVPYATKTSSANLTTTANTLAYYSDTAGTFAGTGIKYYDGTAAAGKTYIRWVKFASIDIGTNNYWGEKIYDIFLDRTYNSPSSEVYNIRVSAGWTNSNIIQLSGHAGTQIMTKFRIVRNHNTHKAYFEYYVDPSFNTYSNAVNIKILCYHGAAVTLMNEVQTENDSDFAYKEEIDLANGMVGNFSGTFNGNAVTATAIQTAGTTAQFYRGDNSWSDTISGGTLKITNNSNTVTIGSQNVSFTHIYNSADIPFIFNKDVLTIGNHNLGSTSWPWGNLYIGEKGSRSIYYVGTKATNAMITFLDNTGDAYGNGIKIGGGGVTVIGAGESAGNLSVTAGTETLYLLSDGSINIEAGGDAIASRIGMQITTSGHIIPVKAEAVNNNVQDLGSSSAKWANIYGTTFDGTILKLHQGTAADPSLSGNARIEFDYSAGQPVVISYTPNDSYRAPAGLKIMGGSGATPAWLEVEGDIYAAAFKGNAITAGTRWDAITQGQKWSRICLITPTHTTEGTSGILSISCTRANVVVNATFLITLSYGGTKRCIVSQIGSNNYSYVKIRGVVQSNGTGYIELYDFTNSIASGTTQTWHCAYLPLLNSTVTAYTTFTTGETIPSGYAAENELQTLVGDSTYSIINITRDGTTFTATRSNGSTFTFTQQDSDTKSFTITANATDGYWDLTGTNGTNAVTYALAPYSSKQSGANFYTGTTNPDGTTRLNYNGYLYATKLYSGGTEVSVNGHNHDTVYLKKADIAVSNTWSVASNDTTKKIPMISTTVNGVTGTAVAIPEASTSAGGIVTIGTQNFGGSKTFTGDTFEIRADIIRLRNKANSNNAATNQPYVTSLIIGDGRYINFTEYKDDHLVINSKSILLDTTSNGISAYDSTKTYSLDTIVWYDKSYYYCSTAITEAEAWNSAHWTAMPASNIMANASFVPWKNNSYALGSSSYRWSKVYIGTENSYGNDTTPIYWNNGVPKACTSYANASVNYATSAGSASSATTATYSTYLKIVASNEIRFDVNTKPSSATDLYIGYAWSDGSKDAKINGYKFEDGNSNLAKVYASEFVGPLNGNAYTASKITNLTTTDMASSSDVWRRVWFCYSDNVTGRPAYKDTIAFQTSTNTLKSGKYLIGDHVTLEYNSTDDSLDFIFI